MPDDPKCDPIKLVAPSDTFGGDRELPRCLPAPPRTPDVLNSPEGQDEQVRQLLYPKDLEIGNRQLIVYCSDLPGKTGSHGKPVSVEAMLYKDIFRWASMGISLEVLDYIATNKLEDDLLVQFNRGILTIDWLINIAGMTSMQATDVLDWLNAAQEVLDREARTYGLSLLDCIWENGPVQVYCDNLDYARADQHPDAVYTVIVPAGKFQSDISQEDANRKAQEWAMAQLNCFYINEAMRITCQDRPWNPTSATEEVPNDLESPREGLEPRKGSIIVPAGMFRSYLSSADANDQARQYAYAALVCYYISEEVNRSCVDPEARGLNVDPAVTEPAVVGPGGNAKGQIVTVPAAYITSIFSTEDATSQAGLLAESLLECCFRNREMYLECPPYKLVNPDGTPVLDKYGRPVTIAPASHIDPEHYAITIPAGMFTACTTSGDDNTVSQETVDDQARQALESSLVCYYCNEAVMPTCVPEWVLEAVSGGFLLEQDILLPNGTYLTAGTLYKVDLPLRPNELIDPTTGDRPDFSLWSIDATTGVPASVYCSQDYKQSQQIADSSNTEPVKDALDTRMECVYANDQIIASCSAEDPFNVALPITLHKGINPRTGEVYWWFSKHQPITSCLDSELSSPGEGEYIYVPAGTITATAKDTPNTRPDTDPLYDPDYNAELTKRYVNEQAILLAESMLQCLFSNPETTVTCEGETTPAVCWEPWTFGLGLPEANLTDSSHKAENPLIIPKQMFFSAISLEDVYVKTKAFAESSVFCLYYNDQQAAYCPPNLTQVNTAVVAEGTVFGNTREEANALARQMAQSMVACVDLTNTGQGPPGPAGPPGPPGQSTGGDCKDTCFGVYS